MIINFSKMQGLGNDFMMVDSVSQNIFLTKEQIRQLADRNFGIGFDQLLMVEPPYDPELDFHYRIFNADGGQVATKPYTSGGAYLNTMTNYCTSCAFKRRDLINRNKGFT